MDGGGARWLFESSAGGVRREACGGRRAATSRRGGARLPLRLAPPPELLHGAERPVAGRGSPRPRGVPAPLQHSGRRTPRAFGHLGFTNVLAWADPERDISVALMNTGKPLLTPELVLWMRIMWAISDGIPRDYGGDPNNPWR